MGLSRTWHTILTKLAEYGTDGIDKREFIALMGAPAGVALDKMFFTRSGYIEQPALGRVAISDAGREALRND